MIKTLCFSAILLGLSFGRLGSAHPFHISVTDIMYKPDDKLLQVSVRLFLDDLEVALRSYSKNAKLDITQKSDSAYLRTEIGRYVREHLSLKAKKPLVLSYLGFEYDRDVLWCYFEVYKVRKLEELGVRNSLLVETFDDQENITHVRRGGKVKSLRFSPRKQYGVFHWDED